MQPASDSPIDARFDFTRARARGGARIALALALVVVAVATAALLATPRPTRAAASSPAPVARIPALDTSWFALGASLPWYRRGCDFGCGAGGGVRGTRAKLDPILRDASRRGVRVIRWELLPADAWQVRRTADGTPTSLAPAVAHDLDAAISLARKHDLYLLPVLLPDPARVPASWYTDPAQSAALAATIRPLFARYRTEPHLLGWELASGDDELVDRGIASRDQVRLHLRHLVDALAAVSPDRLAFAAPSSVARIDTFVGLDVDAYDPFDPAGSTGDECASCRTAAQVAAAEGADAPIVIGAFEVATQAQGTARLDAYVRAGYSGALAWSWRAVGARDRSDRPVTMPDTATWRLHYAQPRTGPRARPLNPCTGPAASQYRCPNLRMSTPFNLSLAHHGRRSILFSANSLNSRGAGPASLHGRRDGRFTMAAQQVLHRRDGRTELIPTGARLLFKPIPGQYRYWKWNGAARMELWRLDSTGALVTRVRVGPKTVYCLRDLKRTAPQLARSPRSAYFPGCSQDLGRRSVTLGTSVGWSDIYPATYHENWIDVTGLRGCFAYVHIADPTNVIYESDEDDNSSATVVRLPFTGSARGCPGARPLPTVGETGTY